MTAVSNKSSRRVLLLTYYFPSDLCAGSFRAKSLADALISADPQLHLDVVTTEPNRYQSHRPESPAEDAFSYSITRITLPEKRHGFLGQIRSFLAFAAGVRRQTANNRYDLVIATSSRLMTACLGAWVASRTGARLYLDIRDIFVETLEDVFPGVWLWPVRRFFSLLERWPLSRANRVNLVSEGFLPYFQARYNRSDYAVFTNGIDEQFVSLARRLPLELPYALLGRRPHIVYAGNIGDGQGLEKILPALALALKNEARFTVVGDGGARDRLVAERDARSAPLAVFDPMPRDELIDLYDSADVLFLHLNDYPAFRRVLPSKLFEYAATGKPILAGVAGYAQAFIERELTGAEVFAPCDKAGAVAAFHGLIMRITDRSQFVERFNRAVIMSDMAEDILRLIPGESNG